MFNDLTKNEITNNNSIGMVVMSDNVNEKRSEIKDLKEQFFNPNNSVMFFTINPNRSNNSMNTLIYKFKEGFNRYNRQELGPRYHKYKVKQNLMRIFAEDGKFEYDKIKNPHLHILISIPKGKEDIFINFMETELKLTYPTLSSDAEYVQSFEDFNYLVSYGTKAYGTPIYGNEDLCSWGTLGQLSNYSRPSKENVEIFDNQSIFSEQEMTVSEAVAYVLASMDLDPNHDYEQEKPEKPNKLQLLRKKLGIIMEPKSVN